MSLFRSEVIQAQRRRLWGEVRVGQPPSLTVWTIVVGGVSCLLILALLFGTYVRKETVVGYIAPEAGIIEISVPQPGRVIKVLVREGDHVIAGTPLVQFTGESNGTTTGQVLAAQIGEMDQQINNLDVRKSAALAALSSERGRLRNQMMSASTTVSLLRSRRNDQIQVVAISKAQLSRYKDLAEKGYASQYQIDSASQQVLIQQATVTDLEREIEAQQATINDLGAQLAAMPSKESEIIAGNDTERSVLKQKRIDYQAVQSFTVRAPVDSVVANLQVEPGQTPKVDMPLISLMPDGSPLQAELLVPTRAVGFLKPGEEARLQIDAFPFQKYGFVTGQVLSVSHSVLQPGEYLAPVTAKESVYRVRVSIDKSYVQAYGKQHALRPGMSLAADLIIDRKALWKQLFDPFFAAAKRSE